MNTKPNGWYTGIVQIEGNLEKKHLPRKNIIRNIVKLQKMYGNITSHNLSKHFGIKLSTASSWLTKLENEGKIKKTYQSWNPNETRRIFILNK